MSILIIAGATTLLFDGAVDPVPPPPIKQPPAPLPQPIPPPPPPACPTITLAPSTLPPATVSVPYSQQLSASGGAAPYTFHSTTDLPPGLTLSSSGLLSGNPTTPNPLASISILATDANGCMGSLIDPLLISPPPPAPCPTITLSPLTLPGAVVGTAYSQQITAAGGTAPYAFTAMGLPAGLAISGTGLISGTPTQATTASIVVSVHDVTPCPGSQPYSLVVQAAPPAPPPPPSSPLGPSRLTYIGSWRVPQIPGGDLPSYNYGGYGATFNPNGNGGRGSLLVGGFQPQGWIGEMSIPAPVIAGSVSALPFATSLKAPFDPTAGHFAQIATNPSPVLGGMAFANGKLIVSLYVYYDGLGTVALSHFVCDGTTYQYLGGPYQVLTTNPNIQPGSMLAGWVAGYMAPVPSALQAGLGGPWFTGQGALSIITRTSFGPSLSVFDPSQLGVASPVPASLVMGYPAAHPALGDWASTGGLFNGATDYPAMVVIDESALFGGRWGSTFGYGEGTSNPALAGTINPADGSVYVYDPTQAAKGTHGFPYKNLLLAYDLTAMAAVKAGTATPWSVTPYANWEITFPFPTGPEGYANDLTGMAWDPTTRHLFVLQQYGDGTAPLVNVYAVS